MVKGACPSIGTIGKSRERSPRVAATAASCCDSAIAPTIAVQPLRNDVPTIST